MQSTSKDEIRSFLYLDCIKRLKDNGLIKLVGGVSMTIKFQQENMRRQRGTLPVHAL